MNSEINKKTPAFIYAKEFKLSKVLGNLQAYKLATGDVGQAEIDEASQKHGNDLGAVYGSLITKATLNDPSNKRKGSCTSEQNQKRRRRRKRRVPQCDVVNVQPERSTRSVTPKELSEPLPLPECLLQDDKTSELSSSNESSCSDSEEEYGGNFFGLSSNSTSTNKEIKSAKDISQGSHSSRQTSRFPSEDRPSLSTSSQPSQQHYVNALTTYECWKCKRRGHLAEHCTVVHTKSHADSPQVRTGNQPSKDLQELFIECKRLRNCKSSSCNECGNCSNIAYCFECRLILCDGRGHLIDHLLNYPTHNKIYSYKLQRLLKCSNASCNVHDVTKLVTCSQCLSKTFDKHYSLVNATWSERGLRAITSAISCQEHFHWHRMNCYNSLEETLINREKLERLKQEHNGLLSEFFF